MSMEGIKSKDRVQQHGEVFTPDSIVNDMLDLTDKQLNREDAIKYIDYTYLEPSCGNGNFLVRILDRKLEAVQKLPREEWGVYLVRALSRIYAIDIQGDNVEESKERLLNLIKNGETELLELKDKEKQPFHFEKMELTPELESTVKFVLDANIQQGDCLTGKRWKKFSATDDDLIITEYLWDGTKVSRKEFMFNSLDETSNTFNQVEAEHEAIEYLELRANSVKKERMGRRKRAEDSVEKVDRVNRRAGKAEKTSNEIIDF